MTLIDRAAGMTERMCGGAGVLPMSSTAVAAGLVKAKSGRRAARAVSTASGAPAWLGALTCLQVFRGASLQERADDLGLEDPGEAFGVLLERVLGQFAAGGRSLDACGPAVTLLTDAGGETVARAAFGFASNSVDGFVASPGPDKLFMLAPSQGPSLAWLMSVTNVLVTVAGRDLFA